jgi:hypothetical protein
MIVQMKNCYKAIKSIKTSLFKCIKVLIAE